MDPEACRSSRQGVVTEPRAIVYGDDAVRLLALGAAKLSHSVATTLGPGGRPAALDQGPRGILITKDGVTVARDIDLRHPVENIGVKILREASEKACSIAGDGTTTAVLLGSEILRRGRRLLRHANVLSLIQGLRAAAREAASHLTLMSVPCTLEKPGPLRQVALIAANGDGELADRVIEAYRTVGVFGVILIEGNRTHDTTLRVTQGMQLNVGAVSPLLLGRANSVTLKEPLFLLSDGEITSLRKLLPILEACRQRRKPLVIMAGDIRGEALEVLVVNRQAKVLDAIAVKAPGYGSRRGDILHDVAILTGARGIWGVVGILLELLPIESLGCAKSCTVSREMVTILGGASRQSDVTARVRQIQQVIGQQDLTAYDREKHTERLSKLLGGVVEILVGGGSELEIKERKDRCRDAVLAVKSALEEGIVPGGGTALTRVSTVLTTGDIETCDNDHRLGRKVLIDSLTAPLRAIASNAGWHGASVVQRVKRNGHGFDAISGELVDLVEHGIVDPTKVVRIALAQAVSVATMILSSACVITRRVG